MGIVWGLATALSIGFADLFARRIVHRHGALVAGVSLQGIAIVTSVVALFVVSSRFDTADIGLGLVSGLGMGVGMWGYLGGLQAASATVVAPIVATMSAVIPYGYAVLRGASPAWLGVVGAVVAIVGLVVITTVGRSGVDADGRDRAQRRRAGIRWAVCSGCGYGVGLSMVIDASSESGSWPALGQRVTAFALILVACRASGGNPMPPSGLRFAALGAGMLTGLSTIFYLLGVDADPTGAVVTASIFPAISVVVGRAFYGDEVAPRQVLGIGVTLLGIIGVALA